MVRVFGCHHFVSQEVFCTEAEPLAVCCDEDKLFVATSQCYIEVYNLRDGGKPEKCCQFPSIARVSQLAYSATDNFVATVEETSGDDGGQRSVRVYFDWQDQADQPMRATIAGHMTSIRHLEGVSEEKSKNGEEEAAPAPTPAPAGPVGKDFLRLNSVHVVEIPLKDVPTVISVDGGTGNLAVAINDKVLLYALCCKTVAHSNKVYEDMKCVLELQFHFKVRHVELAEEYLMACSRRQVQVVRLNLKQLPASKVCRRSDSVASVDSQSSLDGFGSDATRRRRYSQGTRRHSCTKPLPPNLYHRRASSQNKDSSTHIVEDENCVFWDFDVADETKTLYLKGLHGTVRSRTDGTFDNKDEKELIGPFRNHPSCPATVEYEDSCGCGDDLDGILETGVTTLLYRQLDSTNQHLHSVQLIPIYLLPEDLNTSTLSKEDWWETFISAKRPYLAGMFCLFSTPKQGYMYDLTSEVKQLAAYPYTSEVTQARVNGHFLYAISQTGVEMYSARHTAAAMNHVEMGDTERKTMPSVGLEPCLVGLQPFIGLQAMAHARAELVLLSKVLTKRRLEQDSWSLYILRKPSVPELYRDMVEMGRRHQELSQLAYWQLLQEAYLLLRSHCCLHGSSICGKLLAEACAEMGNYFARHEDVESCLAFYKKSGLGPAQILAQYEQGRYRVSEEEDHEGILCYLNTILFDPSAQHLSQSDADTMVDFYSKADPANLSVIVLCCHLHAYSKDAMLQHLLSACGITIITPDEPVSLEYTMTNLALTLVQLLSGAKTDASKTLKSVSMEELSAACLEWPQILYRDLEAGCTITPLAKFIAEIDAIKCVSVLALLVDEDEIDVEEGLTICQTISSDDGYVEMFLSCVLGYGHNGNVPSLVLERLCDIYLGRLQHGYHGSTVDSKERNILTELKQNFPPRSTWLNCLPPFQGNTDPGLPCQRCQSTPSAQPNDNSNTPPGETCSCYHGNIDLVKLQCVLASKCLPEPVVQRVNSAVRASGAPPLDGRDSLHLLCLCATDVQTAVDTVMEHHQHALVQFCHGQLGEPTMWFNATEKLVKRVDFSSIKDDLPNSQEALSRALSEMLSHCATILQPEEFMKLVPPEGSSAFFLPFIETNQKTQAAAHLKAELQTLAQCDA